jgi:hypothetical protein
MDITDKKYYSYHITQRFLLAMDRIIGNRRNGKVTAAAFGEIVGMKASNISRLRDSTGENCVTVEAIGRIYEHYKISPYWLITGQGDMWSNDELYAAYQALEIRVSDTEEAIKQYDLILNKLKAKK